MSAKDLKALEQRFFNECNKGKAAAMAIVDETGAPNIVFHDASGNDIHGLKGFKKHMSEVYSAFPDAHWTIHDMIVEGDKAVVRYTVTCTHKGEFGGIPATNRKLTLSAICIDRIVGGKFVESWERHDTLGLMQQLGVVPTLGKGK